MSRPTPGSPATPAVRITQANDAPVAPGGDFVLYWMTASRRARWNFALQRAVEHANALRLPLLVLEPLRAEYRWACDRFHRFVIDGMVDNQARLKRKGVAFYNPAGLIARLPIDHGVGPVDLQGGAGAAEARLSSFVDSRLASYATERNRPELDATSGLSPYLHFGHVSAHEVLACIADREGWTRDDLADDARGHRAGWWGMTESSEAFLDQLVTWRELGFNRCLQVEGYDRYEALPAWARETLAEHASDPREVIYGLDDFEFARTHDPLWNAAQNQLRREGRIHNHLRMLWGKKILEWSESARTALQTMIALNDKYALDGRDPNSYTGILRVLGLHDRAWGPERPVFGKVRYMSSANTARKYRVRRYVERYSGG